MFIPQIFFQSISFDSSPHLKTYPIFSNWIISSMSHYSLVKSLWLLVNWPPELHFRLRFSLAWLARKSYGPTSKEHNGKTWKTSGKPSIKWWIFQQATFLITGGYGLWSLVRWSHEPSHQSHAQLPQTLTLQLLGANDVGKPTMNVDHFPRHTMSCSHFFVCLPQGTLW